MALYFVILLIDNNMALYQRAFTECLASFNTTLNVYIILLVAYTTPDLDQLMTVLIAN